MEMTRTIYRPASTRWTVHSAAIDLIDGLKHWELWSTHGWNDIRQRYRRSVVGPFWLTISMALMVGGLAYLYAGLFGQSIETFLPYVAVGMIVFNLISGVATEGSVTFISSARIILQTKAPLSVYVYQMLWRNLLIFAHNMCIYLVLLVFFNVNLGWITLLSVVGLFLLMLNGVWAAIILGGLSARFRDVPPIVASLMQIAFFLSPVFWTPSSLKGREVFVDYNPFYYMIEVIRMPLLGQMPSPTMWLVVIGINCVGATIAILFYARYRARIPYWV